MTISDLRIINFSLRKLVNEKIGEFGLFSLNLFKDSAERQAA